MTSQNILWPIVMGGPSHAQLPPPKPTETPYTLTLEYSQFLKHHLTSYFQLATLFPLAKLYSCLITKTKCYIFVQFPSHISPVNINCSKMLGIVWIV